MYYENIYELKNSGVDTELRNGGQSCDIKEKLLISS
jgi:hypothetical protein